MSAVFASTLYVILVLLYQDVVGEESPTEALELKLVHLENKQTTDSEQLQDIIVTVNQVKEDLEQCKVYQGMLLDTIEKVDKMNEKVEEMNEKVDKLSTSIAFRAAMTGRYFRPKSSSPLPFNRVYVNLGNGYSGSNYKFTCPVSGLYYFSFSVYSSELRRHTAAYQSYACIYHGSTRVAAGESSTYVKENWIRAQTAASAVVQCGAGEHVYVLPGNTKGTQFWGSSSHLRSIFTGFLVSAD